jgi:predicted nucleic acid-binding protein
MALMTSITHQVLLDTSIIIGFLHGQSDAIALFKQLRKNKIQPGISVMTKIELIIGFNSEKHRAEAELIIADMLCHPLMPNYSDTVAQLLAPFKNDKQRKASMLPDAIIAATAENLAIDICTANINHFNVFSLKRSKVLGYQALLRSE